MKIVVDTREQRPFFRDCDGVETEPGKLESGDYSIAGLEHLVAVERKSLGDLVTCFGKHRERFQRELDRLRGYEAAVIVCEEPWEKLRTGQYLNSIHPNAAVQTVIAFMVQYGIQFYFADSREDAEQFTYDYLRHFANMIRKRYEAAGVTVVEGDAICKSKQ